jgi:hypothetical protein
MKTILARNIVDKWVNRVISQEYSITVHPNERKFKERTVRELKDQGWEVNLVDEKLVIVSNDPIKLARLSISLKNKGYFVQED